MHFRNLIAAWIILVLPSSVFAQFEMGPDRAVKCQDSEPAVQYYRSIAEAVSLVEPISGIGKLSEDIAMQIAHFRFTSEPCGGLEKIQYYHGKTPKPIDENYTSNRFTPASNIIFHRDGPRLSVQYRDHNNRPVRVFGDVAATRLDYDKNGKLSSAAFLDTNGDPTTSSLGYATVRWTWHGENQVTEQRFDNSGTPVKAGVFLRFSTAKISLGENGFANRITSSPENIHIQFERDAHHALTAWRLFTGSTLIKDENSGLAGIDYHYDQHGYLKSASYFDADEKPVVARSGHMGFVRTYDHSGNRLGYNFIDSNGKMWSPPGRGYAGQLFHWRADGVVRTRTEYIDQDGKLINHPDRKYAAIEYYFDARNDVTLERHFDATGTILESGI